jgi:hypothetical protein
MHGMFLSRIAFHGSTCFACFAKEKKEKKLLSHNYFKPFNSKKTLNIPTYSIEFGILTITFKRKFNIKIGSN